MFQPISNVSARDVENRVSAGFFQNEGREWAVVFGLMLLIAVLGVIAFAVSTGARFHEPDAQSFTSLAP